MKSEKQEISNIHEASDFSIFSATIDKHKYLIKCARKKKMRIK